ncbi:D-alanyl-D-alanine carboxypeptidase family protein [Bacillus thuringiensis]|uniref:D-alanyl-D-alanine carboxypeptidase family protein n=1 Tax=Bacillus thuringiensis TaxID=1428 RepID=UPI000E4A06DF|nr:D-alanyl-D-alanine carboxypeptidase family protein [Bacillus thuringiensis]MDZ3953399.1 D-alanyl-D-alanine carboxypeptidase family protein [Bacillus thuringiensis]RGP42360.1 D-alanyl-D-alanine carboxypeptidase [Bacillus thuringiensis]
MKILKKFMYLLVVLITISMALFYFKFSDENLNIQARAAVLIDAHSGSVLYQKNAHIALAPASMSKMMTEYIVLERIHNGSLKWGDLVKISPSAVDSEGVKINVRIGDRLTVRDLFHAMVICSANNAAVALAEHIASSEKYFTKLMNDKAKQLNLSVQTHFVNATGLANNQNQETKMTALDVAKLARYLLKDYPDVLETTKLTSNNLNYNGLVVQTTNRMLYPANKKLHLKGVDGLKTGFTDEAGYCFTGTAKQDGKRVISVVMGGKDDIGRFKETKKLFVYGFKRLSRQQ